MDDRYRIDLRTAAIDFDLNQTLSTWVQQFGKYENDVVIINIADAAMQATLHI